MVADVSLEAELLGVDLMDHLNHSLQHSGLTVLSCVMLCVVPLPCIPAPCRAAVLHACSSDVIDCTVLHLLLCCLRVDGCLAGACGCVCLMAIHDTDSIYMMVAVGCAGSIQRGRL